MSLNPTDQTLLEAARCIIKARFKPEWHTVGCAIRTGSGRIFSAVHLDAHVGRVAVCAEAIALGMAAAEGDTDIATVVAVDHHGNVAAPCGICRELISDYSPNARVVVPSSVGPVVVPIAELLPNKYRRPDA